MFLTVEIFAFLTPPSKPLTTRVCEACEKRRNDWKIALLY